MISLREYKMQLETKPKLMQWCVSSMMFKYHSGSMSFLREKKTNLFANVRMFTWNHNNWFSKASQFRAMILRNKIFVFYYHSNIPRNIKTLHFRILSMSLYCTEKNGIHSCESTEKTFFRLSANKIALNKNVTFFGLIFIESSSYFSCYSFFLQIRLLHQREADKEREMVSDFVLSHWNLSTMHEKSAAFSSYLERAHIDEDLSQFV